MPTYLQPDVLARAEALGLKARTIVEGLRVGDHKSPYPRVLRRVRPAPRVRPRRRHPPHRLEELRPQSERYTIKQYEQETNFIGHILLDASRVDALRRRRRPTSSNTPSCWPRRWRT